MISALARARLLENIAAHQGKRNFHFIKGDIRSWETVKKAVKDVVDANVLAMEKNCAGGIFNVATGSQLTMNKLFEILQTLMGKSRVEPIYDKPRPFDIRQSCGDISRANEMLGFKPKVSLEEGLLEFIKRALYYSAG